MNIVELFKEGGFIMYPLLFCSLAMWTVILEKMWSLAKFNKEYKILHAKAIDLLKGQKIDEAKGLFINAGQLIAAPHMVLFEERNLTKEALEDKISRRLLETQMGLKKSLWILGTLGSSAPFIGLFGTVMGIIKSFSSMAETGKGGFSVVAAGLSEALIATAAGILVAVVAVISYNYFQVRLTNLNLEFKNKLQDLMDLVVK